MIKVGDIVANITKKEFVGEYYEKFDVRVIEEMLPSEAKFAEVSYIDSDGAIITKEFGSYAFPDFCLRKATEEETEEFLRARYTLVLTDLEGADYTLPLELSRKLVERGITFNEEYKKSSSSQESFCREVVTNDTLYRAEDKDEVYAVLLREAVTSLPVIMKNKSCPSSYLVRVVKKALSPRNKKLSDFTKKVLFEEATIQSKDFYSAIERGEDRYEFTKEQAVAINTASGYFPIALVRETKLSQYLSKNRYYDGNFEHMGSLIVDEEGLDKLVKCGWSDGEKRRCIENLSLDMKQLQKLLVNPQRDFRIDMDRLFKNLPWEDIMANKDLFASSLSDKWAITSRVTADNYIPSDYIVYAMTNSSCFNDMLYSSKNSKGGKANKLKDLVATLTALPKDAKIKSPVYKEGEEPRVEEPSSHVLEATMGGVTFRTATASASF